MADKLGEAYVEVRGDMTHLGGDMASAGHAIKSKLHEALTGFGPGGQLAGAALAGGVGGIVGAAANQLIGRAHEMYAENRSEAIALDKEQFAAEVRLKAALEATSFAAGVTSSQLREQAEALESATGVGTHQIMEFQQHLLAFQNVQGETFERATKAALEYSEATGRSLPGAAMMLGRALNEPLMGMMMLRRMTIQLTQEQQKMVKQFVAGGEIEKAQAVILTAIEHKYGNFAERSMTSVKRLNVELERSLKDLGRVYREGKPLELRARIISVEIQKNAMQALMDAMNLGGLVGKGLKQYENPNNAAGKFGESIVMETLKSSLTTLAAGILPNIYRGITSGSGMDAAKAEQTRLDKLQEQMSAKQKRAAYEDLAKAKKESTQGFFDPQQFSKRIQESLLGNGDKMLGAAEDSAKRLQELVDIAREGGGGGGDNLGTADLP